jgi:UDP-2,4-diacetamido-2,4,6-trideoxy-beta-L-altropyranose hydrolase
MAGVAFRVDASIEIGTGHFVRCLTLADALSARDFEVTFITRGGVKALEDLVCARGFRLEILATCAAADARSDTAGVPHAHWLPVSWREDARQTREVLARLGTVDWLVVDHYALDAEWENVQRLVCKHILVIDDLADRRHDCDILVDQNFGVGMERRYDWLVPPTCRRLVGPRYALLRSEFAELRRLSRNRDGSIRRIFVFMGGTDATNETGKVLDALSQMPSTTRHIDVVVGAANPHADRIEQQVLGLPGAHLHTQISNMAELMAAADLSVGAGGGATWERCCLGLPTIAFSIADNQTGNLQALVQNGSVLYLGVASTVDARDLAAALATVMRSPDLVVTMARRSTAIADGLGCERVASALCDLPVRFRSDES